MGQYQKHGIEHTKYLVGGIQERRELLLDDTLAISKLQQPLPVEHRLPQGRCDMRPLLHSTIYFNTPQS